MPKSPPEYDKQRMRKNPPHVPLRALRVALKLTLDEVCDRMAEHLGKKVTKGALSAIENGHRGASPEILSAIEFAFDLEPGTLTTDYSPVRRRPLTKVPA